MRNNLRYQNPSLPNGGVPADLEVPLADWRYPGQIGSAFTFEEKDVDGITRSKTWMLVKTASVLATATVNGTCLWWSDQDAFTVTTLATNRGRVAGVALRVCAVNSVVAIQIGGRHPGVHVIAVPTAAASVAGMWVVPSATDARADVLALGTAPTHTPLGYAVGVNTANFVPTFLTLAGYSA